MMEIIMLIIIYYYFIALIFTVNVPMIISMIKNAPKDVVELVVK